MKKTILVCIKRTKEPIKISPDSFAKKWTDIQEVYIIHGTKHHKDNQSQTWNTPANYHIWKLTLDTGELHEFLGRFRRLKHLWELGKSGLIDK